MANLGRSQLCALGSLGPQRTVHHQSRIRYYSLKKVSGCPRVCFDPATGSYGANGPVALWEIDRCPVSETPLSPKTVAWFAARARLQLSVLAETALAAMPESPDDSKAWKPARGRRLLVFSDSRAEAARLGPRLTRQHELQVFRAVVVDRIDQINLAASEEDQEMQRQDIARDRSELETATPARRAILLRRIEDGENNLRQMGEGIGSTLSGIRGSFPRSTTHQAGKPTRRAV